MDASTATKPDLAQQEAPQQDQDGAHHEDGLAANGYEAGKAQLKPGGGKKSLAGMGYAAGKRAMKPRGGKDGSAARAMREVFSDGGKVSVKELAVAILEGIADKDGNAATKELATIRRWMLRHQDRLAPGAMMLLEAYSRLARSARESEKGFTQGKVEQLESSFKSIVQSAKHDEEVEEVELQEGPETEDTKEESAPKKKTKGPRDWQRRFIKKRRKFFKRQGWHPRFNRFAGASAKRRVDLASNSNCGPTSLAMALEAYGLEPKAMKTQKSIDRARKAMTGNIEDDDGTDCVEHARGASKLGLKVKHIDPKNRSVLNKHMEKGHMVILTGKPQGKYVRGMRRTDPGYACGPIGHSVLLVGRTAKGRYLVADPMAHKGAAPLKWSELKDYFMNWSMRSTVIWRAPKNKKK